MEGSQDASYERFGTGSGGQSNDDELPKMNPSVSFQEQGLPQHKYNSDTDPRFQLTATEIGQLTNLRRDFRIHRNNLNGPLPSELGLLSNLK